MVSEQPTFEATTWNMLSYLEGLLHGAEEKLKANKYPSPGVVFTEKYKIMADDSQAGLEIRLQNGKTFDLTLEETTGITT